MIQTLRINRELSPRRPFVEARGTVFNFAGYHRALPLIAKGASVQYASGRAELTLTISSGQRWQLNIAGFAGEKYVNPWHQMLGIRGNQLQRKITTDPNEFFRSFLRAVEKGATFTCNLVAETDEQGAIVFKNGKEILPLMAHRFHYDNRPNARVKLVPFCFEGEIAVAVINEADGRILTEVDFDNEAKLFFFRPRDRKTRQDEREYLIMLSPADLFPVAQLPGYQLHFTRSDRRVGEAVKVRMRKTELLQISAFRCLRPLTFRRLGADGGKELIAVGPEPNLRFENGKLRPQVRVHTDSQRNGVAIYYTSFAGVNKIYLPLELARKYALAAGKMVEIEPLQGRAAALYVEKDGRKFRLPLVLVWRWEEGEFKLVQTVSEHIYPKYLAGYCVIEQKETLQSGQAEYLSAGNRRFHLFPSVSWKTKPQSIAAFLDDSGRVVFFRDTGLFSAKDWKVIRKFMEAKCGKIAEGERKISEAEDLAAQADALLAEAKLNILDLKGFELAQQGYLDAFLLDPCKTEYLEMARQTSGLIMVRKYQLERRGHYLSFLEQKEKLFSNCEIRDETIAGAIADYLASFPLNAAALAYFLEVLAGMAEGQYAKNPEPYQRAFRCLPLILDQKHQLIWFFMGALRILMATPDLNYVTRYILNSPPPHSPRSRELFATRRDDADCPNEKPGRSWKELGKARPGRPIPKLKIISLAGMIRAVRGMHQTVSGLLTSAEAGREQAEAIIGRIRGLRRLVIENTDQAAPVRRRLLIALQGLQFSVARKFPPDVVE